MGSWIGDDYGPNCLEPLADDMWNCTQLSTALGGQTALQGVWMGCSTGDWTNWQQTIRSNHAGGAYGAIADGSVQYISDLIESSPAGSESDPTVWDSLIASGDGHLENANNYGD